MNLSKREIADQLYSHYQLDPKAGIVLEAGPWRQSESNFLRWGRDVIVREPRAEQPVTGEFVVEFAHPSDAEVARVALEGIRGANPVSLSFNVFIYSVVHAKVGPIEATSPAEAILKAEARYKPEIALSSENLGGCQYVECSDGAVGYLVDQLSPVSCENDELVVGSSDLCNDGETSSVKAVQAILKLIQQAHSSDDPEQRKLAVLAAAYHDFTPGIPTRVPQAAAA